MNRGDALRKKFAAKAAANPFDAVKADFNERLDDILLAEKNAGAASTLFVDRLYAAFTAERPSDLQTWLGQKLTGLFVSIDKKPQWAFEPSWCFEDGVPLEFLHQFEDDDQATFYVFRGHREGMIAGVKGKLRFIKLVAQTRAGNVLLDGEIVG
ncbi:hypothetical protein [Xanthomonas sp. 3058]|uniref:hypothetical protein n=1 Tax=Xanthomonas sp. 3058 TaxID=3035314 RepID=UPI0016073BE9|nr:hypothetical protein [Xanthomonas sp. 3058]MBB5864529.1 hypothetical protein [Xanthomonas sp. 3058]